MTYRDNAKVLVILVNYNGIRYLKACLESLLTQTYRDFDVALIDNNSWDDSISFVSREYPWVKIFPMKSNLGFAEGNNVGMEWGMKQNYSYIALLNNDTTADPDWLEKLVMHMEENDQLGAVSAKLVFFKKFIPISIDSTGFIPAKLLPGSTDTRVLGVQVFMGPIFNNVRYEKTFDVKGWQPWEVSGFRWSLKESLCYIPVEEGQDEYNLVIKVASLHDTEVKIRIGEHKVADFELAANTPELKIIKVDPAIISHEARDIVNNFGSQIDEYGYSRDIGFGIPDQGQFNGTHYTNVLCGANMLIRTEALWEVGIFEPSFFMYYEDVELCLRLKRYGWMLGVTNDCIVRHIHSATSVTNPMTQYYIERNRFLTLFRYGSSSQVKYGLKVITKEFLRTSYWLTKSIIKLKQVRHHLSLWKLSTKSIRDYLKQFKVIYSFRG